VADTAPPAGQPPPDGLDRRALVDWAYEEYCRLLVARQAPLADEYCARFPTVHSSLHRLVMMHEVVGELPETAVPPPAIPWPQAGERFLGFALERELGRGGFARVFLATEPALGNRQVVVKVSRGGGAEAETLGRLQHPHIVPVYSIREEARTGLTAVCMPYLGSATLHDLLDRAFARPEPPARAGVIVEAARAGGAMPAALGRRHHPPPQLTYEDGILRLVLELADALAYVHAQGLCHGDLKPSNVLLDADGEPLLLDFNLSFDSRLERLWEGGTYPYMSPEQFSLLDGDRQQAAPADARSDVFSLGVLAYELLTGKNPFGSIAVGGSAKQKRAAWLQRLHQRPPPLRALNTRVRPAVAAVVERCLAFDPDQRPAGGAALAQALRRCLPSCPQLSGWIGRRRRSLGVAAAFCLTGVAAAALVLTCRDPYSVRQFRRGLQAYEQKNYDQAVTLLTRSLEADAARPSYLARGRAYQQLGCALAAEEQTCGDRDRRKALDLKKRDCFVQALQDYEHADPEGQDGSILACRGFCLGQQSNHLEAIYFFDQAIEHGFAPAAVFNDRGFNLLQLPKRTEASADFNRALHLDPTLQTVFFNQAQLCLNRALASRLADSATSRAETNASVQEGLEAIRSAADLGPLPTVLYRDAARLCLAPRRVEDRRVDQALAYLKQAIEHGFDPKNIPDPLLESLQKHPSYQSLLRQPAVEVEPIPGVSLVDPLQEPISR
jgi:serine/threonine protein kinase/Tfp pilus assembly protein PilF